MMSVIKKIRNKIYSIVFVRTHIAEVLTVLHDLSVHLKFSFNDKKPGLEKEQLEYYLIKHCHIVEKGLALPEPRRGFGQPKITTLINQTRVYEKHYSDGNIGLMVRDTLRHYLAIHAEDFGVLPPDFLDDINCFLSETAQKSEKKGGVKCIKKVEMATLGGAQFEAFLKCRHSVRNFSDIPVDDELIIRALQISQNTPSVCNRQGWFTHYYSDKQKIRELLFFQNGNSGFTNVIDKLLIVTASVKAFTQNEYNQLFIDGGLYSMNLLLSLHAVGLGSCSLNTCMPWFRAKRLKKAAGIPQHEQVIMMIAVGNLLDEFAVAQSEKSPVEKITIYH